MSKIRCKVCNTELDSHPTKTKCCGCSNMTTIKGDTISANDLSKVVMISTEYESKRASVLSNEDLEYQNARRNRKVKKLDFEVR